MPLTSESGCLIPAYGEAPPKPGLYLGLLHGRHTSEQVMNDWGFNGPLIGPIAWCHTSYATHIRVEFISTEDEEMYFSIPEYPHPRDIQILNDLLTYNKNFYGDWSVFVVHPHEIALPKDTFRNSARRNYFSKRTHLRS